MLASKKLKYLKNNTAIRDVIGYFGGVEEAATAIGISKQAIYRWISNDNKKTVPTLKHCKKIEILTSGYITKEELRPDVFDSIEAPPNHIKTFKKGVSLIRQAFREISEGKQ